MNITEIIYPVYFIFSFFIPQDYNDNGFVILNNLRGSINNSYVDDYYYDDDDYYYFDDNYRLN